MALDVKNWRHRCSFPLVWTALVGLKAVSNDEPITMDEENASIKGNWIDKLATIRRKETFANTVRNRVDSDPVLRKLIPSSWLRHLPVLMVINPPMFTASTYRTSVELCSGPMQAACREKWNDVDQISFRFFSLLSRKQFTRLGGRSNATNFQTSCSSESHHSKRCPRLACVFHFVGEIHHVFSEKSAIQVCLRLLFATVSPISLSSAYC